MIGSVPQEIIARARSIRAVVLDVDGVLTDGGLHYTQDGEALKRFHVRDGLGIRLLLDSGVEVAILSARASLPLDRRVSELGIRHFLPGSRDKLTALRELIGRLALDFNHICFVGDDLLDVPALRAVGLAVAVADGHPFVRSQAHWVTQARGGEGAVREVADLILEVQAGLEATYEAHLAREQARARVPREPTARSGFGVIIPARFASTRLPGKPLRPIAGKPMILHVLERARLSGADFVCVATDDARIASAVEQAGGEAIMTSSHHTSGTDRLAEAVSRRGLRQDDIVVNVQGDEPLIDPSVIRCAAKALADDPLHVAIATIATPITDPKDVFDPNVVKVVVNAAGMASYFSRAPIPWLREAFGQYPDDSFRLPEAAPFLRHIGLYAYRVHALSRMAAEAPVPTEQAESLEQLRALWHQIPIRVVTVPDPPGHGVDTETDLKRVCAILEAQRSASGAPTSSSGDAHE